MIEAGQKKSKTMESAEQIGNNEDLLTEILLNLPTKSLIRFRLVSKQWMLLISSARFCYSHTQTLHARGRLKPLAHLLDTCHSPPSVFGYLPVDLNTKQRLPYFDFIHMRDVTILQSSFGLLLCVSSKSSIIETSEYFICNPSTRKFKMISFDDINDRPAAVHLAYDPLKSPHYKIISVLWMGKSDKKSVKIYSSETNSWSQSKTKFFTPGIELKYSVFFNGAIHWYSSGSESMYFDVENECFKPMPMPMRKALTRGTQSFGECGGHLNLATSYWRQTFTVHEMKDDYSGWYLKYCINLHDKLSNPPFVSEFNCGTYLLFGCIQSDDDGGDSIRVVLADVQAIAYNFKDQTLTRLQCRSLGVYRHQCFSFSSNYLCRACPYFETLSCI
ncbi:hypothetical protein COLO4_08936 [Corchorus olitorius]|uniref:F-box domain-containing protein n=1 Tax=Corchorus olitorius TaxID=93759 RepID=A0A1R3KDY0_9ROSI|nr:hypothetical protein COLO4_08936 [Corchorus olitorius]